VTRRFYGYGVPFIVQNVGTIISSVTANFTSFDGQQQLYQSRLVMPGRSTVFDPDVIAGLTDGTQYSVVVNSDQPVAVVANAHNELVGPVAYAHNGLTTGSPALYAPYVAKSGPGATTDNDSPVVIQNVGNFDVDVTLKFIPLGATDVDTTAQTFVLPAIHSLTARVFDPRFAFDPFIGTTGGALCHVKGVNCLGPGEYSLIMSGNGAIAAVVLPTGPATAAAYVAQTSTGAGSHAFLPNVTRNLGGRAGWTTPFAVQSINATNAIFRWYRFSDGSLVKTETRRLVPGAALWIDPRDISGLADDAQYSLDIGGELGGSSGQLTAIVYERATGGDSAMIYEGFPGN